MFEKYSISRDLLYSIILTLILSLISIFSKINFIGFDTKNSLNSLVSLTGILFGFILTIIVMLFMFDPKDNPIFKKLQTDGLFNQIFKRFFDSLILIGVSVSIFLILNIYFIKINLPIFDFIISSSQIINPLIIVFMVTIIIRLYRCLSLLKKI